MRNYQRAKAIIQEKREILACLAEALLVRETLDANDVILLMKGLMLPPKARRRGPPHPARGQSARSRRPQPRPQPRLIRAGCGGPRWAPFPCGRRCILGS